MSDIRLTSLSHGGGCGCKIAPAALTQILAKVPRPLLDPALLVGIETSDDAAVYRLNDEQAVVATTDFFMPIVDDPYDLELGDGHTTGPLNYFIYPHVEVAGKRLDNVKRSFRFSEIRDTDVTQKTSLRR